MPLFINGSPSQGTSSNTIEVDKEIFKGAEATVAMTAANCSNDDPQEDHTIMRNYSSFIDGLVWARKLGKQLTDFTGVEIFPYSVFYVYYEQYLTTIHDMGLNIGLSIGK